MMRSTPSSMLSSRPLPSPRGPWENEDRSDLLKDQARMVKTVRPLRVDRRMGQDRGCGCLPASRIAAPTKSTSLHLSLSAELQSLSLHLFLPSHVHLISLWWRDGRNLGAGRKRENTLFSLPSCSVV